MWPCAELAKARAIGCASFSDWDLVAVWESGLGAELALGLEAELELALEAELELAWEAE